jgi:4'-phosphopantetheinyl transferase
VSADLDLWYVDLDPGSTAVECAAATLDADERRRAAAARPDVRRRRVMRRAALRRALGTRLRCDPAEVVICRTERGKPLVEARGVDVSVTSSGERCLIAVSTVGEVGVDLEWLRPLPGWEGVAARAFAPSELASLQRLPAAARNGAFFACWTQREACLKALGIGIAGPPGHVVLELRDHGAAAIRRIGSQDPARWSLGLLGGPAGGVAALAVRTSRMPRVRTCELVW